MSSAHKIYSNFARFSERFLINLAKFFKSYMFSDVLLQILIFFQQISRIFLKTFCALDVILALYYKQQINYYVYKIKLHKRHCSFIINLLLKFIIVQFIQFNINYLSNLSNLIKITCPVYLFTCQIYFIINYFSRSRHVRVSYMSRNAFTSTL